MFSKSKGLEKVLRHIRTIHLFPGNFPTFFEIKFLFLGALSFSSINLKVFSRSKTTLVVFLILPSIPRIFSEFFGAQRYFSEPRDIFRSLNSNSRFSVIILILKINYFLKYLGFPKSPNPTYIYMLA